MSWMSLACFFTPPGVKTLTPVRTACSVCFCCQSCKPVGVFLRRQCSERRAWVTHAATGKQRSHLFCRTRDCPFINVDHILRRQYLLFISVHSPLLCRQHVIQHESCEIPSYWIISQFTAELRQKPFSWHFVSRKVLLWLEAFGQSWCTQATTSDVCLAGPNNKRSQLSRMTIHTSGGKLTWSFICP